MTPPVDPLARFSPVTQAWFRSTFAEPTAAQRGAWEAITSGEHALVVAPTGSGKTLAAFLAAIDRLVSTPMPTERERLRVVYVSPLKALAADIQRNLRGPLAGIAVAAERLGIVVPELRVAMRTGDTPAVERQRLPRHPPDILVTTPESLYLLLTSKAREALRSVETVIVDEIHVMAATKRGAHLALSLERLDALLTRPAQRIGLSATVRPVADVARFLGGSRPVREVVPETGKQVEVRVVVAVEDMAALGELTGADHRGEASSPEERASIWPHLARDLVAEIEAHRSTIVFVNSRRLAERLCAQVNEAADRELARAHHGSVSREQRQHIEEELKAGRLPAVIATSSLELGIDMGAVDLVVQVEAPGSVAQGLQRIGRAGHQVGAVSRGLVYPKYRGDLLECAVVSERMAAGQIEAARLPRNPLDVLAQQIVAMVAVEDWKVADIERLVRRAAPYRDLPYSALEAVLDMLAGGSSAQELAALRPRLVWDRELDLLSARSGALHLAVVSGGTIPDRGLFTVQLVGSQTGRVGELDEEMVYESRVGDVFTLGASSWRIEQITADRVLVSPAPGQPGKAPFWHGDQLGRPMELGRALGAFTRELLAASPTARTERLAAAGLDARAADNLMAYLDDQVEATGSAPSDEVIVVERYHDELGDWRVCVHSPFGALVHAPWAQAIEARAREVLGVEVQAIHSDDGLVLRVPDGAKLPGAELLVIDPSEVEALVTEQVGGSALFASRFRECAARSLLLPRRRPGERSPLWQQRQRASSLLEVVAELPTFPVILETMRECLQDVFDLPGLIGLMASLARREIRLVEVETAGPSPFAAAMQLGYVAAFMYEGEAPLAERRARALALDRGVLAELLGQAELRDLIHPGALADVELELQQLAPTHQARDAGEVHDLLRRLGELGATEVAARLAGGANGDRGALDYLEALVTTRRALGVRVAGQDRWIAIEDAARYRDGLGVALPQGVPAAFLEPVADSLGDLVERFARSHGPFVPADVGTRLGLGVAVVEQVLERLQRDGVVSPGAYRPGATGAEWIHREVLGRLRARSLAVWQGQIEPAAPADLARLLSGWQRVGGSRVSATAEALWDVVGQVQGAVVPASVLERQILASRLSGPVGGVLDELCAAGAVVWAGLGGIGARVGGTVGGRALGASTASRTSSIVGEHAEGEWNPAARGLMEERARGVVSDGWLALYRAEEFAALRTDPNPDLSPMALALRAVFEAQGALFFRQLVSAVEGSDREVLEGLWELVWGGWVSSDTLAPLRALLTGGLRARSSPRGGRGRLPTLLGPPAGAGRWSLLSLEGCDLTRRAHASARQLLERHGIVTRGAVISERVPGGFAAVYPVLARMEEAGRCRRGYFVDGLGGSQFALPGAVDRLRAQPRAERHEGALLLAATDPANPYGAALPWPASGGTHRPGRKAGSVVLLRNGALVLYLEAGARSAVTFTADADELAAAAQGLADGVRSGFVEQVRLERVDGVHVQEHPFAIALRSAGFLPALHGLQLGA